MKAQSTTVVLNNRWGYCYNPNTFISRRKALEYARWMIKHGYAWAYHIINSKQKD